MSRVAAGGPRSLIEDRVSGLLCQPEARALATRCSSSRGSPLLRERLAAAALRAARARTWERALERLADGYERALGTSRTALGDTRALPIGASSRAA